MRILRATVNRKTKKSISCLLSALLFLYFYQQHLSFNFYLSAVSLTFDLGLLLCIRGYMDFDALNPSKLENAYRFYCRLELCNKVCLTVSVFVFVYHLSSSISIVILPILKLLLAFISVVLI